MLRSILKTLRGAMNTFRIREDIISQIQSFVRHPSDTERTKLLNLLNNSLYKDVIQEIMVDLYVKQKDLAEDYNKIKAKHDELANAAAQERRYSSYRATIVDSYWNEDGEMRVVTNMGGIKEEMCIGPNVKSHQIIIGNEAAVLSLNGTKTCIAVREPSEFDGSICKVDRVLDENRIMVSRFNGSETIPGVLRDDLKVDDIKIGMQVRIDLVTRIIYELLEDKKASASRFTLAGNAGNTFDNIGGLSKAKEALHSRLILPIKNPQVFTRYGIKPIRGVLLFGPPGCGKTMIAGAIFNELNKVLSGVTGQAQLAELEKTHFFSVSGPEILSKWVGEAEETIRNIFRAAKDASSDGFTSVIFWDEIDAIARTRQETHSYAVEKTIVPALLSELNGLDASGNVVLIAATNRPDLLDPALVRAGRLGDLKIEVSRPNREETADIIQKYLKPDIQTAESTYQDCIDAVLNTFFNDDKLGKITLNDGGEYLITGGDFVSGATINKIIQDALMSAALNEVNGKGFGINKDMLIELSRKEIREQSKLLRTHNVRDFITLPENNAVVSLAISVD